MERTYVYRIEHRHTGKGLYASANRIMCDLRDELPFEVSYDLHPTPFNEPSLGWSDLVDSENWFFGFSSPALARRWLHSRCVAERLDEHGMVLRIFEVAPYDCKHGVHQSIFVRCCAKVVAEHSVDELWGKLYMTEELAA